MSVFHLTQMLSRAIRQYPNRVVTVFGERRRTYTEFYERVTRMAGALQALGMQAGDRVGILALNSDRYLELYFAIWWGGGAVNPVNVRWSPREVAYSLDDCETRILVVDDNFVDMANELRERSKCLATIVHMSEQTSKSVEDNTIDYEQLIETTSPVSDALRCNDDLAGIFYTGGTTGVPKGVMLSHTNMFSCGMSGVCEGVGREGDIGLHAAPMFHLADGFFMLVMSMLGCTQVMVPRFEPELVLETIQKEGVTITLIVPTMVQMLVDHPKLSSYRLDSFTRLVYGASPISEALLRRTRERLPHTELLQAYGQTEMSPVVSALPPQYHEDDKRYAGKIRSAGRPAVGIEVKIVDADDNEVPPGTVGEIAARGPNVMQGYWNKPEETTAALRGGWMHTGDGAYMDEDGFIFVVDRVKDMIISGGENVYSVEVENAIAQHPAVAACAVIGIPDSKWGEAVHAFVVRKSGADDTSAEDIKMHCREYIADYKCPRSVEFCESLPLSGAGKVLKTVLREPYWKDKERKVD